jgi:hypothetical protein
MCLTPKTAPETAAEAPLSHNILKFFARTIYSVRVYFGNKIWTEMGLI